MFRIGTIRTTAMLLFGYLGNTGTTLNFVSIFTLIRIALAAVV